MSHVLHNSYDGSLVLGLPSTHSLSQNQQVFEEPPEGIVEGGCLICLRSLSLQQKQQRDWQHQSEIFVKILKLLNVNLSPFKYNFAAESFPFCGNCTHGIYKLIDLQEKLISIQKEFEREINEVKLKLKVSEHHKKAEHKDVRVIIFRGQVLGNTISVLPVISNVIQQQVNINNEVQSRGSLSSPQKIEVNSYVSSSSLREGSQLSSQPTETVSSTISAAATANSIKETGTQPTELAIQSVTEPSEVAVAEPIVLVQHEDQNEFKNLIRFQVQTSVVNETSSEAVSVSCFPAVDQQFSDTGSIVAANETVVATEIYDNDNDYDDYEPEGDDDPGSDYIPEKDEKPERSRKSKIQKRMTRNSSRESHTKTKKKDKKRKRNSELQEKESASYEDNHDLLENLQKIKRVRNSSREKTPISSVSKKKIVNKPQRPKRERKRRPHIPKAKKNGERSTIFTPAYKDENGREFIKDIELIRISDKDKEGYQCGKCNKLFINNEMKVCRYKIIDHIRGVHLELYKCEACPMTFTSCSLLSGHFKRYHVDGFVPCDICLKPVLKESLPYHKWSHMNENEKEKAKADGLQPKKAKRVERENGSMCGYCGQVFKRIYTLKMHELTHTSKNKLECSICGGKFSYQRTLIRHIKNLHTEEGKTKINRTKYLCVICQKRFRSQYELKLHKKSHTKKEERPFECSICAKRFNQPSALKSHVSVVHNPSDIPEDRPYPCELCGQRFRIKKNLRGHMRCHPEHMEAKSKARPASISDLQPELVDELPKYLNQENDSIDDNNTKRSEYFPFVTNADGDLTYCDIKVTKINGGYTCGFCGKDVLAKEYRERQIKGHINGCHFGMYRCDICSIYCKSRHLLARHKFQRHVKGSEACKICGRVIAPRGMDDHLFTHMNEEEKEALIASGNYSKVPIHIRKLRNLIIDKIKSIPCEFCDEAFSLKKEYQKHCREQHPGGSLLKWRRSNRHCPKSKRKRSAKDSDSNDTDDLDMSNGSESEVSDSHEDLLECSLCAKRFNNLRNLKGHITVVHKPEGEELPDDLIYPCEVCGKKFKTKKHVKNHMRYHPKQRETKMKARVASSVIQPELLSELSKYLNQENKLTDDATGAVNDKLQTMEYFPFVTNADGDLTYCDIKVTRIKGGYNCGFCGKDVLTKEAPDRQIKGHINGCHFGMYRCDICLIYYKSRHSLARHRLQNHVKGKEPCKICNKAIAQRYKDHHLWTHMSHKQKEEIIASGDYKKVPLHVRKLRNLTIDLNKSIRCEFCDKIFPLQKDYWNHCREKHPGRSTRRHRRRNRPSPSPKSKKRKTVIFAVSDSDETDNTDTDLSYESESEVSDSYEDFEIVPIDQTDVSFNSIDNTFPSNSISASESSPSVSIIRLPEALRVGKNFKVINNMVYYTTSAGRNMEFEIFEGNCQAKDESEDED